MRTINKKAKTIDEAIEKGLKELGVAKDKVDIRVLEEPKNGLFGFIGSRDALVELTLKEMEETKSPSVEKIEKKIEKKDADIETSSPVKEEKKIEKTEISEEQKEEVKNFLKSLLKDMGIDAHIESFDRPEHLLLNIINVEPDCAGIIIGKRGDTLDAIQYLTNLVANKNREHYQRIVLDINDYRAKRENSLIHLAKKMAGKAKKTGRSVRLEPMNPYERRVIHSALQNYHGVITTSEGNDPYRKVVIKPSRKK